MWENTVRYLYDTSNHPEVRGDFGRVGIPENHLEMIE